MSAKTEKDSDYAAKSQSKHQQNIWATTLNPNYVSFTCKNKREPIYPVKDRRKAYQEINIYTVILMYEAPKACASITKYYEQLKLQN